LNNNPYKSAMEQVEFDKNFEAEAAVIMAKSMEKKKTGLFVRKLVCCSVGAAACIALVIFAAPFFLKPTVTKMAGDPSVTAAASDTHLSETSFAAQTSVQDNRLFVNPDLYYSSDSNKSYTNPEPGKAVLTFGLENAVIDPVNENSLYFVFIGISTPEERANSEGYYGYIYNGKTIAQWEELLSLAQGNYSYTRYNEDHGGNITEEQWNQKKNEAITMNAAENSGAAFKEFSLKYNPITEQSIEDAEDSECARLQNLGYDVYIYEYQTNYDGEMRTYDVLAGTLTKDQILRFDTDAAFGYSISWAIIDGETIDKGW